MARQKRLLVSVGGMALMIAASAQAAIIANVTPNSALTLLTSTVPGATILTFDADSTGASPTGFAPATGSDPGGAVVAAGGNPSLYAAPVADTTQFYAVAYNPLSGTPTTPASDLFMVPGGIPQNYFGLYWGSIDTYNTITFELNGVPLAGGTFSGTDFSPANGSQTSADTNEYIYFVFTDSQTYNAVLISTFGINFELDNIAYGLIPDPTSLLNSTSLPEPTSLTLLGYGLFSLGLLRLRRNKHFPFKTQQLRRRFSSR